MTLQIENGLRITLASSVSVCGCNVSGPMDLHMSGLFKCSLTWSSLTKGMSSLLQTFCLKCSAKIWQEEVFLFYGPYSDHVLLCMDPGATMAGCPLSTSPEAKITGAILHYCVLALSLFGTTEFPWFLSSLSSWKAENLHNPLSWR